MLSARHGNSKPRPGHKALQKHLPWGTPPGAQGISQSIVLPDAVIFLTSLMVFLIKPQMVELDEYVKITASL